LSGYRRPRGRKLLRRFNLGVSLPGAVLQRAPRGEFAGQSRFTFEWDIEPNSTWYRLYLAHDGGSKIHDAWYRARDICRDQTCQVEVRTALLNGSYAWWVQPFGPAGYGTWSDTDPATPDADPLTFSLNSQAPVAPALRTPRNGATITQTAQPGFGWDRVTDATWYQFYLKRASGVLLSRWYTAEALRCADVAIPACVLRPGLTLEQGDYDWWVRAYGPAGYGPWSDSGTVYDHWFTADAACSSGPCMAGPGVDLAAGDYTWAVTPWGHGEYGPSAARTFTRP
jgi:hypothetical protein